MNCFMYIHEGASPLILSMPHAGTMLVPRMKARLTNEACELPDTDWWIDRLYDFATDLDATIVRTQLSRYVVDVNRDPSGRALYPGQVATGLVPMETFDGLPIYRDGNGPDKEEIAARQAAYFDSYHAALGGQIERIKMQHGLALLYDCHSIRSFVPRLFDGELPVFNIGSNDGASCAPALLARVSAVVSAQTLPWVVDGRFKGGWITRGYGRPGSNVHALQMELAQRAYMTEQTPWTFDEAGAEGLRPLLRRILTTMLRWAEEERRRMQ